MNRRSLPFSGLPVGSVARPESCLSFSSCPVSTLVGQMPSSLIQDTPISLYPPLTWRRNRWHSRVQSSSDFLQSHSLSPPTPSNCTLHNRSTLGHWDMVGRVVWCGDRLSIWQASWMEVIGTQTRLYERTTNPAIGGDGGVRTRRAPKKNRL